MLEFMFSNAAGLRTLKIFFLIVSGIIRSD